MTKKYLFLTHELNGTGGSKVTINLANQLLELGHEVSFLVKKSSDNTVSQSNVRVFKWNPLAVKEVVTPSFSKGTNGNIAQGSNVKLKELLLPYYRFFKFISNLLMLPFYLLSFFVFFKKKGFDVVVQNNIYSNFEINYFLSKVTNFYLNFHNSPVDVFNRKTFYNFVPVPFLLKGVKCLCVSQGIKDELQNSYNVSSNNIQVIYNSFDFKEIKEYGEENIALTNVFVENQFIYVGTLNDRKCVDRIIYTMGNLKSKGFDCHLNIFGEGDKLLELKELAKKLDIIDSISFLSYQDNVLRFIRRSKCLLLSSNAEGLPTVLIEALILGTNVISTDCPTGPNEILTGAFKKYLVPLSNDENAIIDMMTRKCIQIMEDEIIVSDAELEKFSSLNVIKLWQKL
ncbi:putative Glycosyltransferase [Vibrio chagasii]|nr:putative Glycosyltransferase [Vibrio chagasii]CAH6907344.1 putative Glycosyltransferase [Vibrio chagasii]